MFTGLVEALGTVWELRPEGDGCVLHIAEAAWKGNLALGESVAVNGVCLTVVECRGEVFLFQVGPETLRCTTLGELRSGDRVNLERSLRLGDRLGGHLVQGHVDGVGRISRRQVQGEWDLVRISCPPQLASQMVPKGSVAVDGVSLTLVEAGADYFTVALIPHTLSVTTLGFKKPPDTVNLEIDLFGKYIWKYLEQRGESVGFGKN